MRIRIGTGYYGLTTMPSPIKVGSAKQSAGFIKASNTPPEKRPQVILLDDSKSGKRTTPVATQVLET
jgi:hypothetical protein